jgi:hypothetical protein
MRAIGQNLTVVSNIQKSVFHPNQKQSALFSRDVRTHSGVIHGGSGKPMEIDKMSMKCYNCDRTGHVANDCRQPKKTKAEQECFNCNKKGHWAQDCKSPMKKKNRKGSGGKSKGKKGRFKGKKRIKQCDVIDDDEDPDDDPYDDQDDQGSDDESEAYSDDEEPSQGEADEKDFQE